MSKPAQSDAPIRFASATVVKALFVQSMKTKEETATIAGKFGERVKTQVESGNLHGPAFAQAAAIHRKGRTNEIKAKEHLAHLKFYIEIIEQDWENKGHVGNLDDQAKAAAASSAKLEPAPVDANTVTAPGGVPLADAQKMFEGTKAIADNRRAASKALEIPALDPDAPPAPPAAPATTEAAPADKPKRGRSGKAAAAKADAAPPPPPAAVGGLPDDDEEDLKPGAAEPRSRAAGTFSVVH
ncbi:hypothetical protein DK26_23325 [Bosea sp. WAO]|uniref:hypothetical protein n=1 Tax=Bosea sp. WAO TaxID=406341 RepID=UPI00074787B0|nr:hypothetical protein [Bosea sp. WAO]KUL93454.1 hypothetical protein DK26_23325 [Bosea sp. WAO]